MARLESSERDDRITAVLQAAQAWVDASDVVRSLALRGAWAFPTGKAAFDAEQRLWTPRIESL